MTPEERAGEAFSGWMTDEQLADVAQVIAEAVAAERQRILAAIALVQVRHEALRYGVQTGTPMAFHHNAIAGFCRTEAWQIVNNEVTP